MKTRLSIAAALALGTLSLTACGGEPAADEAPEGVPGLQASNARLILPAVEGNPAALYFELSNGGDSGVAVRSAFVEGAGSAQIHDVMEYDGAMQMNETGPQVVPAGGTLSFAPEGLHVMAFDVAGLEPGDTTEVTLTAAGGDKLSFEAEVRGPADDRE